MEWLSWADSRTLIACQCLLAMMFSIALYGMSRLYPQQRGVGFLALGFSLGIPATIMLDVRGASPSLLSIAGANGSLILTYIFLYRGILLFCAGRRVSIAKRRGDTAQAARQDGYMPVLYAAGAICVAALGYFSVVSDRIGPRIAAVGVYIALARLLMSIALWRNAAGRLHMRLFALSTACFALVSLQRVSMANRSGAAADLMGHNTGTLFLLVSFLFIAVNGMFYLAMVANAVADTIAEQAELDFLTGTLNRRGIESVLKREMERANPFAVLLMDIDHFKTINDHHGHAIGDEALRTVTRVIFSEVRVHDKVSRFGGDEFLVMLPGIDTAQALQIATSILETLRESVSSGDTPSITVSIGVTDCLAEEAIDELLSRVDGALYQAKADGRNRVCMKCAA